VQVWLSGAQRRMDAPPLRVGREQLLDPLMFPRVEHTGGVVGEPIKIHVVRRAHRPSSLVPLGDGTSGSGAGFRRYPKSAASRARPRAHRLFTVPSATWRMAAASATEYPWTSTRTSAARCSTG